MKKSLIALAALGAFASAASAQSSVTLYGIIDLGLVKQSNPDGGSPLIPVALSASNGSALGTGVGVNNDQLNVARATKSRLGFRGVEDLGGGLSVKFDLEHRFLGDTGSQEGGSFWDKSIVGITSQTFGEITLGRDYMPSFYVQYLLDPWLNQGIAQMGGSHYAFAGYAPGLGFLGTGTAAATRTARYNNGVFYKAQGAGFTGILGASLKEDESLNGNGNAGANNRYGFALMYNAGPLMAALAYDQSELVDGADENMIMLGAAYDFGFIKPRISYARYDALNDTKPTSVTLAATIPVGTNLVKVGYSHLDWDNDDVVTGNDIKQRKFSLGYEHVLSKRTAIYTDITSGKTSDRDTVNGIDLGIRHMF